MVSIRLAEDDIGTLKAKASLAGMTVSDFIRETSIYGKHEFTLAKLPGGERVDIKEALEGLLDTEHRTVQKHFNLHTLERAEGGHDAVPLHGRPYPPHAHVLHR